VNVRRQFSSKFALIGIVTLLLSVFVWRQYAASQHYQLLAFAAAGNLDGVRQQLARGVDVNRRFGGDGVTALFRAAAMNRVQVARFLLANHADPNIGDAENGTPLLIAAAYGYSDVVSVLISAGADVNAAESRYRITPLIQAAMRGHLQVVQLLLKAGAITSAKAIDGKTALDKACNARHMDIVDVLLPATNPESLRSNSSCSPHVERRS
jgi:uncharacterized protein